MSTKLQALAKIRLQFRNDLQAAIVKAAEQIFEQNCALSKLELPTNIPTGLKAISTNPTRWENDMLLDLHPSITVIDNETGAKIEL